MRREITSFNFYEFNNSFPPIKTKFKSNSMDCMLAFNVNGVPPIHLLALDDSIAVMQKEEAKVEWKKTWTTSWRYSQRSVENFSKWFIFTHFIHKFSACKWIAAVKGHARQYALSTFTFASTAVFLQSIFRFFDLIISLLRRRGP